MTQQRQTWRQKASFCCSVFDFELSHSAVGPLGEKRSSKYHRICLRSLVHWFIDFVYLSVTFYRLQSPTTHSLHDKFILMHTGQLISALSMLRRGRRRQWRRQRHFKRKQWSCVKMHTIFTHVNCPCRATHSGGCVFLLTTELNTSATTTVSSHKICIQRTCVCTSLFFSLFICINLLLPPHHHTQCRMVRGGFFSLFDGNWIHLNGFLFVVDLKVPNYIYMW